MKLLLLSLFLLRLSPPLSPLLRALLSYTELTIHLKVHLWLYVGALLLMIRDVRDGLLLDLLAELTSTSVIEVVVILLSIVIVALLGGQVSVNHAYLLSMHSLLISLPQLLANLLLNEGHSGFVGGAFEPCRLLATLAPCATFSHFTLLHLLNHRLLLLLLL